MIVVLNQKLGAQLTLVVSQMISKETATIQMFASSLLLLLLEQTLLMLIVVLLLLGTNVNGLTRSVKILTSAADLKALWLKEAVKIDMSNFAQDTDLTTPISTLLKNMELS
jgi:hypothetical protein